MTTPNVAPAPPDEEEDPAWYQRAATRAWSSKGAGATRGVANAGAGWVLGLLVWGWIALPMIQGGPAAVRDVWRAKFFNQAPDGSPLP